MKKSRSFPKLAVPLLGLVCMLSAAPRVWTQQGDVVPVANTALTPDPVPTPATGAAVNVESSVAPGKPTPDAPTETEILASSGATFESKERVAVFVGDVRVNDPRFQLACDKLTVFLAKGAVTDGTKPAATPPASTPAPANAPGNQPPGPGGGIDHAYAEGHVIIIQKRAPAKPGDEPKVSIGRGDRADFDNKTGDMVLHGTPSVEQNGDVHQALSPATVITLHKDNSMDTVGPTRTVIKSKAGGADLPGGSPAASLGPGEKNGKKHPKTSGAAPH